MADEQGAIPEGMKAWAGGDAAPADWDGGPVLLRDGKWDDRISLKGSHWWQHDDEDDDIVGYYSSLDFNPQTIATPAADRLTDTGEVALLREALQRIQDEPLHTLPIVTTQRMRNIASFALLGERLS